MIFYNFAYLLWWRKWFNNALKKVCKSLPSPILSFMHERQGSDLVYTRDNSIDPLMRLVIVLLSHFRYSH